VEHLHARQVAPLPGGRVQHGVDEAQLARGPRDGALPRLPRRRDEPVLSRPRPRQPLRRPAVRSRGRLSPHDRPGRPRDPVHRRREGGRAGEAVLHVLLPGCHARAAPRADGVDRQVQGQVRHGLRALPRARVREPETARGHARRRGDAAAEPVRPGDERGRSALDRCRHGPPLGLAERGPEDAVPADGRGVRGLPLPHRPRDRAAARLPGAVG